jgi:hypothetical protein
MVDDRDSSEYARYTIAALVAGGCRRTSGYHAADIVDESGVVADVSAIRVDVGGAFAQVCTAFDRAVVDKGSVD